MVWAGNKAKRLSSVNHTTKQFIIISTIAHLTKSVNQKPKYQCKIDEGMFYTLLSRATNSDLVKIVNFTKDVIKRNKRAKQEMEQSTTEEVLFCNHLVTKLNGTKICLHNIRKWDKHISHFLSDKSYLNHKSIFCFTETHTSKHDFKVIKEYHKGTLDNVHKYRGHRFGLYYNTCKAEII